ncbi:polymer-forming cytoskeletal protein [Candidatus Sulfurimonas baltica]|uniref:Polymer-forming cytoskeletal protein n=2 Tax=Candidatus Sulfurimonas baltica TaxID=2740404 RepID=A0A7S7LWD5_9BACT|nr:polymer-forming cytoskeletal protein [Candidatus Sulfurimonas baltica]
MAIFNNSDSTHKSTKPDTNTTIITAGSKIKGEMNLACDLYVDGEFEGVIHSNKEVNIGKNGHIKGDVSTKRLVVQGYIEGSIHAARVEIKANGRVNGSIESSELVIEAKGIFEGNSTVIDATKAPTILPADTIVKNIEKEEIKS